MSLDALQYGPGGMARFSGNAGRSMTSASYGTVRYPSPFFDIAQMYLPTSFKQLMRWCRYYFLTNPLINSVSYKMAEYPITDLVFDTQNQPLYYQWSNFFRKTLKFKKTQVEIGLDRNVYGNCFVSIYYPFRKYLKCQRCGRETRVEHQKYVFRSFKFTGDCQCGHYGEFDAKDIYVRSAEEIRLIRWNPEFITILHNDATGESEYYYQIPATMANDVRMGKRHVIEKIPQIFIEALKDNKALKFSKDNIHHQRRPTISQKDKGWGLPMLLPVLKDAFYLQILRKAQEAVSIEHVTPLRILFPNSSSVSADPYSTVNLTSWKSQIEAELMRWRCVSPDSMMETSKGLLPAASVEVGDLLKNRKGEFEEVYQRRERPLDPGECAYRLKMRGLSAIDTVYSEEHPIWAAKKRNNGNGHKLGDPEFIEVSNLSVGDYVGYPIERRIKEARNVDLAAHTDRSCTDEWVYVDHMESDVPEAFEYLKKNQEYSSRKALLESFGWGINSFKAAQNAIRGDRGLRRVKRFVSFDEELSYVLGVYAAEGNTSPKAVLFSLHRDEEGILGRLDAFFTSRFGADRTISKKSEKGIQVAYHSIVAAQMFHGLLPGTSINKHVPPMITEAPNNLALAFVRGIMDGRYYADKTVLGTASVDLAEGVRQLLLSWEIMAGVSFVKGGVKVICGKETGRGLYLVQVSGNMNDKLIGSLQGLPINGDYFSELGVFRDGYAWFRIKSIEEAHPETVVSFGVRGDNTFCTWGVATHNCDNNYIPVMPLPVGQQTLGGDGKALNLSQEYRVWSEQIVTGMGVPQEFATGGLSFSGSSVSMRMLENHFLEDRANQLEIVTDFIMPQVGAFMGWEPVPCHFRRFKMADDLQRNALYLQMNQAGKLSDKSMLEEMNWDSFLESEQVNKEQDRVVENQRKQALSQASIQGEAQLTMAKYQARAQKLMQEMAPPAPAMPPGQMPPGQQPGGPPGGQPGQPGGEQPVDQGQLAGAESPLSADQQGAQTDVMAMAQQIASFIDQLPDADKAQKMTQLKQSNPQLHSVVQQLLEQRRGGHENSAAMPAPEQKAPRRGPESAMAG